MRFIIILPILLTGCATALYRINMPVTAEEVSQMDAAGEVCERFKFGPECYVDADVETIRMVLGSQFTETDGQVFYRGQLAWRRALERYKGPSRDEEAREAVLGEVRQGGAK